MTKQLRWLHISDIHFRTPSKLDQNDAFVRIRADLAKRKAEGRNPDLIFVTGDITHSGKAADFRQISKLLSQLCVDCGLPRERVFFCPGNHDSDIRVAPTLIRGCWSSFLDVSALPKFLDTAEYPALKKRQAAYRSFVRSFRGDSGGFDLHELHAVTQVSLGDLNVRVLSINSALLAEGGSADHGRLQVGLRTLEARCAEIRKNTHLVFALIHHPFEWLATFEADRAEALVLESADILIRGHLHQPKLTGSLRGRVVSAAGAVWEVTAGDYEYSFGCLTFDTLNCDIEAVRFVQQTGKWMASSEETPLPRSRDERCTPGAIRAELGNSLKFPAQLASVLSGYTSELMMTSSGSPNYVSTERILAESMKSGEVPPPALGVIRVGTLLTFYGHPYLSTILRAELGVLADYDRALQTASANDAGFASSVRFREEAAEKLASAVSGSALSWTSKLLARLVSEGDMARTFTVRDDVGGELLTRLKAALSAGSRDPYHAWCGRRPRSRLL